MAPQRIAIIGSTGQLGTDLVEILRQDDTFDVMPLRHGECDCTRPDQLGEVLRKLHPDTVINCAAYVRVDDCEDQPDEAFRVNAIGALNVARACAEIDALCVYVSTDYVFDGAKATPYVESDPAYPVNVYGASKLAGEHLIRQAAPRWLIVRVASLFGKSGARGKGGNFIETILTKARKGEPLKVVNDIHISPTYTRDAAAIVCRLLESGATGVVHAANGGSCTWYEFAAAALDICGLAADITPVDSSAYPTRAKRPKNSALKTEDVPLTVRTSVPSWREGLKQYLVEKNYMNRPTVCVARKEES